MIIKEVLQLLENAEHPVARALYKTDHSKVLVIGFKKAMVLKEHQTVTGGKLTVLTGSVTYKQEGVEQQLNQYDETDIPAHILHSVIALEDSLCLVLL